MRRPLLLLSAVLLVPAALYAAAGYWLLPGYLEERLVAEAAGAGYPLRVDSVRTDPFRLSAELEGAELTVAPQVKVRARAHVRMKLASLLSGDFLPERISLSQGAVDVSGSRIGPLGVELAREADGYRVAADGALSLHGHLGLAPLALDAEVSASALPLAAAQPWLSAAAPLRLASGTASARGRLRFDSARKPRLSYAGTLSLADVSLRSAPDGEQLAAWRLLEGRDVRLTLAPNRLEVGEALLQRPAGRLVLGEDRRVNVARVVPKAGGAGGAAFPVVLRRLLVRDGSLDFADLGLEPRFAVAIRDLNGVVSGLGSDGNDDARVELDGRVDRYGTARIRGTLNPLAPRTRTSVSMTFRNLEMKSFTPYSAKFAGYRIESGKLSADLRYRVRDSRLVGDNRVVIDSLVLGERVAGAPELPIELAVALLTDARGRIELGLPVRGDLSDPDFSLARLAGKAFGSLLEKVVSAPFRLIGSMLGGRGRDLDGIVFDPGSARLAPPQQESAEALARALAARPQISVEVTGGFDSEADSAALRNLALRQELVRRSGFRLPPGEDPGSLDPSDPRTRQAMETLFIEHGGKAMEMREMRRAADGERRYLRQLGSQIAARMPLPADAGQTLARSRAEAVRAALLAHGVAPQRVRIGEPAESAAGEAGVRTTVAVEAG